MADEINVDNWKEALEVAGDTRRSDTSMEADTVRKETIARSYTINRARRVLDLHKVTIEQAVERGLLTIFVDPEDHRRIPAEEIEAVLQNPELYEQIASRERVSARDIAIALDVKTPTVRKRLRREALDHHKPQWQEIRGKWDLPDYLQEFRALVQQRLEERQQAKVSAQERKRQRREEERRERAELRAQLVASFPAWAEVDRSHQNLVLHIGPPNSGKTHDSLNRLAEAGSGWYLAPLRLLAWEIYDRLNQRGVPCNLLTGEEFIPVEGAEITSATIEMFNPYSSGECVIIDEAQMMADPDRGWAWTRAMMQCEAPEMHVIAPMTARDLIQQMAEAANIPQSTIEHERLSPIRIADSAWHLREIPKRTILVAFSRRMVLALKTQLEKWGRTVSVIYGSLPPEVRRKQADRFASGETEICVATDAVGMGLNLPADYVCFYEVEKYDGRSIRQLKPGEVQQIGGRAGRFGISKAGEVGATTRKDLKIIRQLFYEEPEVLAFARVAPSVDDLLLIPGSLAHKLEEWGRLQSIPQELRDIVTTADMTERIELASMLTDKEVEELGLADALQLVNAPTRKSTRDFWYDCAKAIIEDVSMPLPPDPAPTIVDTSDLDYTEMCIACADIYLWLTNRKEFTEYGEHFDIVRMQRQHWSEQIDEALLRRLRTTFKNQLYGKF